MPCVELVVEAALHTLGREGLGLRTKHRRQFHTNACAHTHTERERVHAKPSSKLVREETTTTNDVSPSKRKRRQN